MCIYAEKTHRSGHGLLGWHRGLIAFAPPLVAVKECNAMIRRCGFFFFFASFIEPKKNGRKFPPASRSEIKHTRQINARTSCLLYGIQRSSLCSNMAGTSGGRERMGKDFFGGGGGGGRGSRRCGTGARCTGQRVEERRWPVHLPWFPGNSHDRQPLRGRGAAD